MYKDGVIIKKGDGLIEGYGGIDGSSLSLKQPGDGIISGDAIG